MSQTCDASQIITNSIICRDKLLRLAELSPNNNNNNNNNINSSNKIKKKQFKRASSTSACNNNNNKYTNLDLSFTDNIEHLVNKDVISTNLDKNNDDCNPNKIQTSNHSTQEHFIRPFVNSNGFQIRRSLTSNDCKAKSFDNEDHLQSKIPQLSTSTDRQYSDLYSKYYQFRQKNVRFLPDEDNRPSLRMHLDNTKGSFISTVTLKSNNVTFIPILDQRTSDHKIIFPEQIDKSQKCSNYNNNNNNNNQILNQGFSSNNSFNSDFSAFEMNNNNNYRKHMTEYNADKIGNFKINTYMLDEDTYTNSPKKISTMEVLPKNDLFNSDPEIESSSYNNKNHDLLEKFLADSQKNSVFTINDNLEKTTESANKSSSCDNLDDIKFSSINKFKSENDLLINRNYLSGISHLEEETIEHDSVINRFCKKLSIRGRFNSQKANLSDKEHSNGEKKIDLISYQPVEKIDINQNKIDENDKDNSGYLLFKEQLSPRDNRKSSINRKSLKRLSRKHARIKRSQTQSFEKAADDSFNDNDNKFADLLRNNQENSKTSTAVNSPTNDVSEENYYYNNIIYAEAIFDYCGGDNEELTFRAGDLIEVTDTSHKQWWWGSIKINDETRYGWFPATYVRPKVSQEETIEESIENGNKFNDMSNAQMRTSISKLSSDEVRANVVLEIINTERDFVKNLKDVIDGYLKPCRDRKDMFDNTRILTIFGNIEDLYQFQYKFLEQLEKCVDENNLSQSKIGNCFLENEKQFSSVYSEFCKNHPLATSELQDLYTDHKFVIFFEGCRLLQNMIDISLDGFLLTPIQKICKYPLQLAELLKYTKPNHCDYLPVSNAYKCMQRVAQMVNERKSRFECLEKLLCIQESFENWEGEQLLDCSSILIHSGEITRITSSTWSKDLTLFLFDHLLVLAKKDTRILKKRSYLFKTRIDLDQIDPIISLEDNVKDGQFNVVAKNAFKFYYRLKQKWYFFQTKSLEEKECWMKAFEEERRRTKEDEEQGFMVTEQDKKGARLAHLNNLKPKKPKSRKPYSKIKKPDTVIAEIPLGPLKGFEIDRNRAGSLPSYIHNEKRINLYKNRQSTMHKKSIRSNWFQLGSNKKNRVKRTMI